MFSAAKCHVLWHFAAVYDYGKIKTMGRFENAPWEVFVYEAAKYP